MKEGRVSQQVKIIDMTDPSRDIVTAVGNRY
jgi:hypothetical protein